MHTCIQYHFVMQTVFSHSSAYTEAYVCPMAVCPQTVSVGNSRGPTLGDEDQGRTSEEEDGAIDNYDRQVGLKLE